MGRGTCSMGWGTCSMGWGICSLGWGTCSMGWGTCSMGWGTCSMGWGTCSMGWGTCSMGWGTCSIGWGTCSMGWGTCNMGLGTCSMGWGTSSMGWGTFPDKQWTNLKEATKSDIQATAKTQWRGVIQGSLPPKEVILTNSNWGGGHNDMCTFKLKHKIEICQHLNTEQNIRHCCLVGQIVVVQWSRL